MLHGLPTHTLWLAARLPKDVQFNIAEQLNHPVFEKVTARGLQLEVKLQ
jgi:hypothetical protein